MERKLDELTISHLKTAHSILFATLVELFYEDKASGYNYDKLCECVKSLDELLDSNLNSKDNG